MSQYVDLPLAVPANLMAETVAYLVLKGISFKADADPDVPGLWHLYRRLD